MVNNNPETVSTDFDTGDRLYFEPLTPEDVMNIIKVEKPIGVVVAFGGQTAIKLTKYLDDHKVKILGTSAESIDIAEDRERFDALLESFGIFRPKGSSVMVFRCKRTHLSCSAPSKLCYRRSEYDHCLHR